VSQTSVFVLLLQLSKILKYINFPKLSLQINGGRPCNTFRDEELPEGVLVCGDHMATATLNGALESGANAGKFAASILAKKRK